MSTIKLVVFDVDGTLTAGKVLLNADGGEEKEFSILDGLGFRLAEAAGIQIAIISGRSSQPVRTRLAALPPENILLGIQDKRTALTALQDRLGMNMDETAYCGDDLNDLPAFAAAGVKIAVQNAVPELKRQANYITAREGGSGAAREAIEWLLRRQKLYNKAVSLYLERE